MAFQSSWRQYVAILCLTGATVIPTFISGALTVALPTIGATIGLDGQALQWPLSVFSLVNGAFLLIGGALADGTSRKAVFIIGNAWLAVASVPLALVNQANTFIALHAVLGFGPAMLGPAATGILAASLPDGKVKNGAFAALGAGQPVGFILGLFFGGIFASRHAAIYAVAAGTSAVFGALAALFIGREGDAVVEPGSRSDSTGQRTLLLKFDWLGATLSALGLVGVTVALAIAGTNVEGWNTPSVISLLPIGAALLAGFFIWERQSQRQQTAIPSGSGSSPSQSSLRGPLIPPSIWSAPGFTPSLACVWFGWFAFNSLTYYCTLVLQEIQGASPIDTSIRFLPMVGAGIFANVLGGYLIGRCKPVYLIIGGCLTCAASCALFALQDTDWVYARGMLPVVLLVVGPDIFFPATQLFACQAVGTHRSALAGSLFNVTTRLATSIGLAICSLVQGTATRRYASEHSTGTHDQAAIMAGYRAAGWLCFGASILAAAISLIYLRDVSIGTRRSPPPSSETIPLEALRATADNGHVSK